jgi:opacity protein-like surface antigen
MRRSILPLLLLLLAVPAAAVDTHLCIPNVGGLAGIPNHLDGVVENDFGWNGATRINLTDGLGTPTSDAKVSIGRSGNFLYFGYTVDAPVIDPASQGNTIVIAFSTAAVDVTTPLKSTDWLIHISLPDNPPAAPASGIAPGAVSVWFPAGGSTSWTNGTVDIGLAWLISNTRWSRTGTSWSLETRIAIENTSAGAANDAVLVPFQGTFRFYTNVLHVANFSTVVQDPFPRDAGYNVPLANSLENVTPDVSKFAISSLGTRPECTGVSLTVGNIGVLRSGVITDEIDRDDNAAWTSAAVCSGESDTPSPTANNDFIARPSGTGMGLTAKFSQAKFGVPGFDFAPLGQPTPGTGVTPPNSESSPPKTLPADLTVNWKLTPKQSCFRKFNPHACIHVQLVTSDLSTNLLKDSVQRNMIFKKLSISRDNRATISGNQGPLIPGRATHDFVITINTDERPYEAPMEGHDTSMVERKPTRFHSDELTDFTAGMTGVAQLAWIARAALVAGEVKINGQTFQLANHVGDFGYIGSHEGPVRDWRWNFHGNGLTPVAGTNSYTISVPPSGEKEVSTDFEAVEGGGSGASSGRWRFFIDAGINFPDASALDGGFSINAGIERMLTPNWSIEGILGYHRFDGEFQERPFDVDAWQLSLNAKYFFGSGALRPFVNGGVGVYRIDPPDDTEFGFNAGAGLLYELNSKLGVEAAYNIHRTDPLDWSTLQLGLRWHF